MLDAARLSFNFSLSFLIENRTSVFALDARYILTYSGMSCTEN